MSMRELISDENGKLSHTKVWANIGYLAATVAFIKTTWLGTASADIWLVYIGCVAASSTASKFLTLKYTGVQSTTGGGQP